MTARSTAPLAGLAIALITTLAAGCGVPGPSVENLPERVDFALHVRPILSDRCFKCHGPDGAARKSDLRLDQKDVVLARLASGNTAVVPGRPRSSELVRRILSEDPGVVMPTPASHLELSDYEKAVLVRWVDQGAEWKPHWSFSAPTMPAIPPMAAHAQAAHPIDRFVAARLSVRGLEPKREAAKDVLIRRVSLTLTGLPPTPAEVDAFVRDSSPDAYERLVDRLQASPAYGERMAADWLDIARFADTHGYQDDVPRDMSPWRDWVIAAFNRNMPVDQFITWQLAGDLLPGATREQRLATAFNRHHMQSQEGGIVPEEYRVEYVADRVQTLGRALLGVTLECARCHDHKYDPVTQREYFQLFSFFNSINEAGQAPYSGMASPTVILPSSEADARLTALRAELAPIEKTVAIDAPVYDAGFDGWLRGGARTASARPGAEGLVVHLPLDDMRPGKILVKDKEGKGTLQPMLTFANLGSSRTLAFLGGDEDRAPETVPGRIGGAQRLRGDSEIKAPEGAAFFERHQPFSLATWFRIDKAGTAGPLITRSGSFANGYRGYLVRLEPDGTLTAALHHVAPDDSIEIRTTAPVPPAQWRHLALTYDGSSRAAGLRLLLDGAAVKTRTVVDNLHRSLITSGIEGRQMSGSPLGLRLGSVGELSKESLRDVTVDDFRAYARQLSDLEVASLASGADALPPSVAAAGASPGSSDRTRLRQHYVLRVDPTYKSRLEARNRTAWRAEHHPHGAAERHGDARVADAAPDVRPCPRRLRRPDRPGHAGDASTPSCSSTRSCRATASVWRSGCCRRPIR